MAGAHAAPLTPDEFTALMAPLGPFESSPQLAVAVSGGADSMALALLAQEWARERQGSITALIVDHRLRRESAAEAAITAERLAARGIPAIILTRDGPAPSGDIQASARAARYRLLTSWCGAHGVLHLLTAHHREDQAETLLLRLGRGSGLAGLAAMPAIAVAGPCQLLRPLLPVAAGRLRATLVAADERWIEDPSNQSDAFARVRLRKAAPFLAQFGLEAPRLAATAAHLGRARASLDRQTDHLLAETVSIHPAGFARMSPAPFSRFPAEPGLRGLAAVLLCIGGAEFAPRFERLDPLYRAILEESLGAGRTLAGCRIVPHRDSVLIYREFAAVAPPVPVQVWPMAWDDRFVFEIPKVPQDAAGLAIGALGPAGTSALRRQVTRPYTQIPVRIWPSLPSLWREDTMICVPHLGWLAPELPAERAFSELRVRFRPKHALTDCGFTVV